jgi:hypothetical protein
MLDPSALTLGQVSSTLRDFTVVGLLLTIAWKSRGVYESAKAFFERLTTHMDTMEENMNILLTNHLTHIEKDLKTMARRQVHAIEILEEQVDAQAAVPSDEPNLEA